MFPFLEFLHKSVVEKIFLPIWINDKARFVPLFLRSLSDSLINF